MEGCEALIPRRPVCRVDLQGPRQRRGTTEQLLVEPVAQPADTLSERALENGVRILPVYDSNGNLPEILLSFVGIQENDIRPALLQLKKAWF